MKHTLHGLILGLLSVPAFTTTTHAQDWQLKGTPVVGAQPGDWYGDAASFSSDGLTFAASAPNNSQGSAQAGHTRVYSWSGTDWVQKGTDIFGIDEGEKAGIDIALSGDGNTIVIGVPLNDDIGEDVGTIRVYSWNGTDWELKGDEIDGESFYEDFGSNVAINYDGSVVAACAPYTDVTEANNGLAAVFAWSGTEWIAKGTPIAGPENYVYLGESLTMDASGNRIAVNTLNTDGNDAEVRLFQWQDTAWVSCGILVAPASMSNFGYDIDLSEDGQTIVVGVLQNLSSPFLAGKTYVYYQENGNWVQKGNPVTGEHSNDRWGRSVSISANGDVFSTSSTENDDAGTNAGSTRIYLWDGNSWELSAVIDGEAEGDLSGYATSLNADGTRIVITASENDSGGQDAGYVRVFEAVFAGIADNEQTAFQLSPNPATEQVRIRFTDGNGERTIVIRDAAGRVIDQLQSNAQDETLVSLPEQSGTYFITVTTAGYSATEKVVKL